MKDNVKPLELPNVTYVMVETRKHQLARLAMEDCLSKVRFGDVLLLTDTLEPFEGMFTSGAAVRTHLVEDYPSKMEWCRANWFTVPPLVATSHMLLCQWDAGVWDPNVWNEEFLEYDFIGAVWNWHPSRRVGNTGFCLKSTRLARYIYDRRAKYPCDTDIEDDLLCRTYRADLEERGFSWAPEHIAHRFSYEGCGANPRPVLDSHFGFHGAFNFPKVFSDDQLELRANLMGDRPELTYSAQIIKDGFMFQSPAITKVSITMPELPEELRQPPTDLESHDA